MAIGDWLVPNPEQFRDECRQREHQTTIAYFGLDLMITKEGTIRCIEINGQHSGTKGFKEAYGEDFARKRVIEYLASFGLPVSIYGYSNREDEDRWAAETLDVKLDDIEKMRLECSKEALGMFDLLNKISSIQKTGEALDESVGTNITDEEYFRRSGSLSSAESDQLNAIFRSIYNERGGFRTKPEEMKGFYSIDQAEGIIWANNGDNWVFDEDRFLVVNPNSIEWATENKLASEILMDPFSPFSCPVFPEQFESGNVMLEMYFNNIKKSKVVLKPVDGLCGDGVVVLNKNKFLTSEGKLRKEISSYLAEPENYFDDEKIIKGMGVLRKSPKILVQPFLESKPFYNPSTGKHHNGAIRYIAMVHSNGGNISVYHIGGYVRLAPEHISDSMGSCVANLAKGAHAIPLSERDQNRLEMWVDVVLPHFYKRALRLAACPGSPVQNCVFVEKFERFYKSPWNWGY